MTKEPFNNLLEVLAYCAAYNGNCINFLGGNPNLPYIYWCHHFFATPQLNWLPNLDTESATFNVLRYKTHDFSFDAGYAIEMKVAPNVTGVKYSIDEEYKDNVFPGFIKMTDKLPFIREINMVNVKLLRENTHFNQYSTDNKKQPIFSKPTLLDDTSKYFGGTIFYNTRIAAIVHSTGEYAKFERAISIVEKYMSENLPMNKQMHNYLYAYQKLFSDQLDSIRVGETYNNGGIQTADSTRKYTKYFENRLQILNNLFKQKML